MKMRMLASAVAALAWGMTAQSALAQGYPERAVRFLVPYAPGGSTDTLARVIGQKLSERWGKPVVVENRPGANGVIGMELAARAAPDGHTIVLGYIANLGTGPALNPKLPYDAEKDFAPISHITTAPSIAAVHPSVPARNMADAVGLERKRPGTMSFGTAAAGSIGHLAGELINRMAGVRMQHVPYKGGGRAVIDVVAGQIPMVIIGMAAVKPHAVSGRLRPIGVTGAKRSEAFPNVPTVAESGFAGFSAEAWYGVLAPAGTPRDIVSRLNADIVRTLALPDVRERFGNIGFEIIASSPEAFANLIREEIPKWRRVVQEAGIKAD